VPIVTTRGILFESGFYSYSDQIFPLSTTISSVIISTHITLGFPFDRLIIGFPYYLFSFFSRSIGFISRAFLFYTFLLYSALCYVFSSLVVDFYSKHINKISTIKRELSKIPIFVFAYSNLSAMQLNADGGTWSDSIILILIAISIILILSYTENISIYWIISAFLILTFLLDPDYAPMFMVSILTISSMNHIINKNTRRSFTYAFLPIFLSIIPLVFLYFQSSFISVISFGGFNSMGYRAYTPGDVAFFSGNINYYNVLFLLGHFWSTLTFSPPSILFNPNKIPYFPSIYYPAQVLLPNNILTVVWYISIISIPILSLSSLLFKRLRKYTLSIFPLVIIAYLMTQEWDFRFIFYSIRYLSYLPFIGNAIGTSFALPGHFINMLAYVYLTLFSLAVTSIIDSYEDLHILVIRKSHSLDINIWYDKIKRNTKKDMKLAKPFIAMFIVTFLVALAGWQAFNGSLYPMRANPGSYLIGNGVEPKGSLSPTLVNNSVIKAYDIVTTNYSCMNYSSQYNTLWIGGPYANDFPYEKPPLQVSVSSLSYIFENSLYNDVLPYLIMHGIRYVVVSNEDISDNVPNPFLAFGLSNYQETIGLLKESGLVSIFNQSETIVFTTPHESSLEVPTQMLIDPGTLLERATLYGIFSSLGYNASFMDKGIKTGFNNNFATLDIINPSDIPLSGILSLNDSNITHIFNISNQYIYINSSMYSGLEHFIQNSSLGEFTHFLPGNFTTTLWSGTTSVYYNNGSFDLSGTNASMSIGYNGALAGQYGGFKLSNDTGSFTVQISFDVHGSINLTGISYLNVLGEAQNPANSTFYVSHSFNVTGNQSLIKYNITIPTGTKYLGFRIGIYNFSGATNFSNVTFTAYLSKVDHYSPFGSYINLSSATFIKPTSYSGEYIFIKNSTSPTVSNVIYLDPTNNRCANFTGSVEGIMLIRGGTLSKYSGHYVTVNEVVPNSYKVYIGNLELINHISGLDGSFIYKVKDGQHFQIVYRSFTSFLLTLYYAAIVVFIVTLIAVPVRKIMHLNTIKMLD
jgi:hypothetical protein